MKLLSTCIVVLLAAITTQGCSNTSNNSTDNRRIKTSPLTNSVPVKIATNATFLHSSNNIQVGERPYFLINDMDEGHLKKRLQACSDGPFYKTDFSIAHRGAPMLIPEHTQESYEASVRMGAGVVECDVTFTKDKELVCRHSQCDLHTTTNILTTSLAEKCSIPFSPADNSRGKLATAKCCTSDITLAEFKTLRGKMDAANEHATTISDYVNGTSNWRSDGYASRGTLLTHKESIALFKHLRVKMTPELKSAEVTMPFHGFTQQQYAQKLIDEYKQLNVPANHVWPQSFNLDDVRYWLDNNPEFAQQAVFLDERDQNNHGVDNQFDPNDASTWSPSMQQLADEGIKIIAPPIWMLLTENDHQIIPSTYATAAKHAGLKIIAWTLERSGSLTNGGGWYYQSIKNQINNDGDQFTVLDILAKDVGVIGVFSDWAGSTTYYASCMGMTQSM